MEKIDLHKYSPTFQHKSRNTEDEQFVLELYRKQVEIIDWINAYEKKCEGIIANLNANSNDNRTKGEGSQSDI